jgi:hypothetical protein
MAENESVKQSANLLRTIIRSIDKKLEYSLVDPSQEGRFSLRLVTRGREGFVSIRTDDLRRAVVDDVRKNGIRQKLKVRAITCCRIMLSTSWAKRSPEC